MRNKQSLIILNNFSDHSKIQSIIVKTGNVTNKWVIIARNNLHYDGVRCSHNAKMMPYESKENISKELACSQSKSNNTRTTILNDNVNAIKSNEHVSKDPKVNHEIKSNEHVSKDPKVNHEIKLNENISKDPKVNQSKSQDTRINEVKDTVINDSQYVYPCLKSYRCKYAKNGVIMYYNVNSLKHKFVELRKILDDALVDVLIIGESKLDETYVDAQFHVNDFKLYRHDRNSRGGGVMVYFNNVIPHRIRNDLNKYIVNGLEGMIFEVNVNKRKWLIAGLYKPPTVTDLMFKQTFCKLMDEMYSDSQNVIVTGDLNFNMNEKNVLSDICDVYRLKNKVHGNTCFKGDNGTSLDVFLVSNAHYFGECINTDIGISDCHNIVGCSLKGNLPQNKKKDHYV